MIRLLGLIVVLFWTNAAQAQVFFSTPASACVPDHATIRDNRATVGNASVRHAGDSTDPIVLTCTITPFDPGSTTGWLLRMTYGDSNGAGPSAFVRARLYRMTLGGSTPVVVATAISNSDTETGRNTVTTGFTHSFAFLESIYWVHIELVRAAPSQNVVLHSLLLTDSSPSDIRLKHNITLLGRLANGLGFYRFSYNGSDNAYVGVMAQEVQAVMPDAVMRGGDGYLRVSYGRLGMRMQAWEEWVAAGEKIPAPGPSVWQ